MADNLTSILNLSLVWAGLYVSGLILTPQQVSGSDIELGGQSSARDSTGLATDFATPGAPRSLIPKSFQERFRDFCLVGDGQQSFNSLKAEFDKEYLEKPLPVEPLDYGGRIPITAATVSASRDAQIRCNKISGIAEAATILWLVTHNDVYKTKAKEALLSASQWTPPVLYYDDESAFRLWRRLPFVYDQIREELTKEEKKLILSGLDRMGTEIFSYVSSRTEKTQRNSVTEDSSSHAIRFVSMVGLGGLSLYDDIEKAGEWFQYALRFYREQYPPFGGDDGGYSEGCAYWRGTVEHGRFQDALFAVGHPEAWGGRFWENTAYFPLYFIQTYPTYTFGDTPRKQGKMTLEPAVTTLMNRLGRRFYDGYISAGAMQLGKVSNARRLNIELQDYPSGMEYLIQEFIVSLEKPLVPKNLRDLPGVRHFRDVGWVSLHSDLGDPAADIMLNFKSSPQGSYSHSFADQNAFILSAYGQNLAIRAGHRDFYSSPHYVKYTRTTAAQNDILIGGKGQVDQSKEAVGKVIRCVEMPRLIWVTGDATKAYGSGGDSPIAVLRDVVFVDRRYFLMRDVISLQTPETVQWLLHAEASMVWNVESQQVTIENNGVYLSGKLISPSGRFTGEVVSEFPVAIDPAYLEKRYKKNGDGSIVDLFPNQKHFSASSETRASQHLIYSVLWPDRSAGQSPKVKLEGEVVVVERPDGGVDHIRIENEKVEIY